MTCNGKIALVTGAGSGIGRGVTLGLLTAGYRVVLVGRRAEPLADVVNASGSDSARTLVVPTDITDPKAVERLFAQVESHFGRLDLLFNNAGIAGRATPLEDLCFEEWKAIIDVNLTGAFLCTQRAFRLMKRQEPGGGRIINNGSVSAQSPRPNSAPYTATKHALTGLTKSTALDGRAHQIACGQIDIGNARTSLTASLVTGIRQAGGTLSSEPFIEIEQVTRAVLFMATLPLDANVLSMTLMATAMPLVGRG
jgi:NAD(P)-dependent dehydrogenase (short-subunit alcohol dehydrogenase family)